MRYTKMDYPFGDFRDALFCPICSAWMDADNIDTHLREHREEGYCLICWSKPCRCMTPQEAIEKFPILKKLPCINCSHFWQVLTDGRTSKLYVYRGKLVMVQACGFVPDYNILERAKNCNLYEERCPRLKGERR